MIITNAAIEALFTGFKGDFNKGMSAPSQRAKVSTEVPSSTASNTYGWLGSFPTLREWLGDRVISGIRAHGYSIKNKSFESTISVKRTEIQDDNVGIYSPIVQEMGRAAQAFPDELIFSLLKNGSSTACYDGKSFFATDHPVFKSASGDGAADSVANLNSGGGGGNPYWYLLDCSRAIRPLIFQNRQPAVLNAIIDDTDESVFMRNEYMYGTDMRCNVGFGFWQMAYASNQTLSGTNYAAARAAMRNFRADGARPLGLTPNVLVVPPALEGVGRQLLLKDANGGNEWFGTADLIVSEWVA